MEHSPSVSTREKENMLCVRDGKYINMQTIEHVQNFSKWDICICLMDNSSAAGWSFCSKLKNQGRDPNRNWDAKLYKWQLCQQTTPSLAHDGTKYNISGWMTRLSHFLNEWNSPRVVQNVCLVKIKQLWLCILFRLHACTRAQVKLDCLFARNKCDPLAWIKCLLFDN